MSFSGTNPNVLDLCRLCLRKDETLLPVFDSTSNEILINKIHVCLAIQITVEDKISQKICGTCLIKLDSFYEFRNSSSESQKILQNWLLASNNVLKESIPTEHESTEYTQDFSQNKEQNSSGSDQDSSEDSDSDETSSSSDDSSSDESNSSNKEKETHPQQKQTINVLPATDSGPSGLQSQPNGTIIQEVSSLTTDILSLQSISPQDTSGKNDNQKSSTSLDQNAYYNKVMKKFACTLCSYSTNLKCNLNKHVMRHNKAYKIKCNVCDKGFYSMSRFRQHTADEGLCQEYCFLKCSECNKRCKSIGKLAEHIKTHDPGWTPSGFQCETCGKMFLTRRGMTKHIAVQHTGVRYKCRICEKGLSSSESLEVHMRTVHYGEKTTFVCSMCNKSYATYKNLAAHEMTHTGERAFPCDICNKVFTQKATLVVHKRYHTGERPFKCNICEKAFVTNSILKSHEKTHKN